MKICLIGEFTEELDEAQRVTARQLAEVLGQHHHVATLDVWGFRRPSFWKKLREFRPDIIHFVPGMSLQSLLLTKICSWYCRGARTVVSAMRPYIPPFLTWLVPWLKPDVILTQSLATERKLESLGCRTRFQPGGVDISRFTPASPERRAELRQNYGLAPEQFIILHVGSIKPGRGVGWLTQLRKDDVQVLVVGPTSVGVDEEMRQRLKAAGCLVWTEYLGNISEVYALADCYVYPATEAKDRMGRDSADSAEMPLSVLEAMATNLPVVTTRFGALPRVFDAGQGLFYTRPEKFGQFLAEIRDNQLEINTRDKVLAYSWENVAQRLDDIYNRLIARAAARRTRGCFICFTGMDGAGKTTMAQTMLASLKKEGVRSHYVHSRLKPFITRPAMQLGMALFLRRGKQNQDYSKYAQQKRKLFRNPLLANMYRYLLFFDYFWQVLFKIRIPLLRGRNIVCDRYVYDTVVLDLAIDLGYSPDRTAQLSRSWLRFLPRPDVVFLVDAPAELVFARKHDIPSLNYLREARNLFLGLVKAHPMVLLDSSRPIAEVVGAALDKTRESHCLDLGGKFAAGEVAGR